MMNLTALTDLPDNFGLGPLRTSVEFDNTAGGSIDLFTVTGDVIVRLVAVCSEAVTSAAAANVQVGIGGGAEIIAVTVATLLGVREIWHDGTPDSEIELLTTSPEFIISDGNDIQLTLSAQVDDGTLVFYLFWTPLSADGLVVVA